MQTRTSILHSYLQGFHFTGASKRETLPAPAPEFIRKHKNCGWRKTYSCDESRLGAPLTHPFFPKPKKRDSFY